MPPSEKEAVWYEETRRIFFFFTVLITIVFGTGSILLIPSLITLFVQQRGLEDLIKIEENVSRNLQVDEILVEAKKIGAAAAAIKEYLAQTPRATALLQGLLETVTPTIVLSGLDIKNSGEIRITGIAATRQELLAFEKRLRASGLLQEISFPISNIIQEIDINFIMQGKIKERWGL